MTTKPEAMKQGVIDTLNIHRQKYDQHEACRKKYEAITGIDWLEAFRKDSPSRAKVLEEYVIWHAPYISIEEVFHESGADKIGSIRDLEELVCNELAPEQIDFVGTLANEYGDFRDAKASDLRHSEGRSTGVSNRSWLAMEDHRALVADAYQVKVVSKVSTDKKEFEFEIAEAL